MAGIYSALGELDRMRKMAGRRVKDLVTDPLGVLTQQADDLRNTQRGVEPVINASGAGMRQIPREEQVSRMTQQALDTYGGGLGMLGHTVFHGSPHRFAKFDKAKIGTGEGAQAFGHGLYVAESPETAQMYRASVAAGNGKSFGLDDGPVKGIATLIAARGAKGEDMARKAYTGKVQNIDAAINEAKQAVEGNSYLYKVDIPDEAVPKMLDWDKPLSEQAPEVRSAIMKEMPNYTSGVDKRKASDAYFALADREIQKRKVGANGEYTSLPTGFNEYDEASKLLNSMGIPGIKYLDAGSREGGGASNMVVFSPEMMRILERNGESTGAKPWAAGEWGGAATDQGGFASPQLLGGMGLGGAGMAAYGLQDDQEGIFSRLGQYLRQRGME